MDDDEILRRLDLHLEGIRAILADLKQQSAEHRDFNEDLGVALRQMTLRADRVALDHRRALQELVAEMREHREEFRASRDDGRDEMLAGRQALFAMIDLLRGGGGGPAPAGA